VSWLLSVWPSISIEWEKKGGGDGTDELVVLEQVLFDPETTEEEEDELHTWLLLTLQLLLLLEVEDAEDVVFFCPNPSKRFPSMTVW
jgi:hypothetical protein